MGLKDALWKWYERHDNAINVVAGVILLAIGMWQLARQQDEKAEAKRKKEAEEMHLDRTQHV